MPSAKGSYSLALLTNAPWAPTGYGQQTRLHVPRLQHDLAYRMAYSAFYGLKGTELSYGDPPIKVYPGHRSVYGNDIVQQHWEDHCAGEGDNSLVITLTDPWVLDPSVFYELPTLAWIPLDHDRVMPMTAKWLRDSRAIPLAMSRTGERQLMDAGFHSALYCPHAYDPTVFAPIPRAQARKALGLAQDKFIVGMVAANTGVPSRKNFSGAVQAFAQHKVGNPDSILYLHTNILDPEGENIQDLCHACDVEVLCTSQYDYAKGLPPAHVATLMNAFDVLLNPSIGEGFGCTMVEAQACGTPVITTGCDVNAEVAPVDAGNWNVGGDLLWTGFDAFQMYPAISGLTRALDEAREMRGSALLRQTVAEWAAEYEIDHVVSSYWKPLLPVAIEAAQAGLKERMAAE